MKLCFAVQYRIGRYWNNETLEFSRHVSDTTNVLTTIFNFLPAYEDNVLTQVAILPLRFVGIPLCSTTYDRLVAMRDDGVIYT